MNRRKILLTLVIFAVSYNFSTAQLGGTHNYLDTTYIAPRNMSQQSEFMKNTHNFPAKPRDMWQLGVFVGFPYVDGDCPTALRGPGTGVHSYAYGGGLSLRKALGYALSIRGSAAYYHMLGLDYQRNRNFNNHPQIEQLYGTAPRGYIHNHETKAFVPSIEALVSLNNIMFHSRQSRWNLYGMLGYSALIYTTHMDLLDASGNRYLFENITTSAVPRKDIRQQLRDMLDGDYETKALVNDRRPDGPSEYSLRHCFTSGVGFEYRIARKASLSAEYKRIATRDDYVDGWFRQSGDLVNPVFTSEWDNIGFISLGANFNIGNSKRRIPPLWWMNPLEFAYSELNNPKHMVLPKVKLDDADGDGVTDQFDLEPNTPPGAPVDTHGVAKDTDGDGVPDYRDKELITLQNCFPVNEDGVGNCPEPPCCEELRKHHDTIPPRPDCNITNLPSVQFRNNSIRISKDAEAILVSVAEQLKANPTCRVKVSGHGPVSKAAQQLSWDRVNAVIKYLVEKQGIAESRFIFEYGTEGDPDTVDLMGTNDQGPNTVPAPHPNLRKNK